MPADPNSMVRCPQHFHGDLALDAVAVGEHGAEALDGVDQAEFSARDERERWERCASS